MTILLESIVQTSMDTATPNIKAPVHNKSQHKTKQILVHVQALETLPWEQLYLLGSPWLAWQSGKCTVAQSVRILSWPEYQHGTQTLAASTTLRWKTLDQFWWGLPFTTHQQMHQALLGNKKSTELISTEAFWAPLASAITFQTNTIKYKYCRNFTT